MLLVPCGFRLEERKMSAYWNMMSQMNGALVECGPLHIFQARRAHDAFGRFGATERNGTVPRSWLFFVLRHVIWQELMRRAPPNRYAPCYGDKIGRCLLSNEHQRDERR